MGRYVVARNYFARHDGETYGPWRAGVEVELTGAVAEWLNLDSPGVVAPLVEAAPEPVFLTSASAPAIEVVVNFSEPEPAAEPEPESEVAGEPEPEDAERAQPPVKDRQQRRGRNRAA